MAHDYDVLLPGGYYCDLIFTGLPEMPRLGAEVFSSGFAIVPGALFYTTLALHRLQLRAGWACDFGDDIFSQFVLGAARQEGLDSRLFRVHPFPVRSVSVSLSFPHDRGFVSFTDAFVPPSPVSLIRQHRPRAVLLSSLYRGPEIGELVAAAHEVGAFVYMDCQSVAVTLATPGVAEALQAVDIFAPNAVEALQLTGAPDIETALGQLAELTPLVVIKSGATGAVAQTGGQVVRVPALAVDPLDTTGAGDCFNAGFLYGYLRGGMLESCLRCGNICGGLSTTAHGAAGIPSAAQLDQWLQDYPVSP
jgi:sugar/nucleoside kinase (ribokinase family)